MKAYKIIECPKPWRGTLLEQYNEPLGRLMIEYKGEVILLATPTLGQHKMASTSIERFNKEGCLEEIDLLNEKWIHPHLYKPLKDEVNAITNDQ